MFHVRNDVAKGELTLNKANDIIGFIDYSFRIDEKNLELLRMFVNYDFRSKNYATILLQEIIKYAHKIRAECITLNINPEIEDCYNTLARENGFESFYSAFIDFDEEERDTFIEKAKKLQENRKNLLMHLFQRFGFTIWNEGIDIDRVVKKKSDPNSQWFILRF